MNREELFNELHYAFTGERGKKSATLEKYEKMGPEEGYYEASLYLEKAKNGQDNCQSDWTYWQYEGDITMATVLMNVFGAFRKGVTEFPAIPHEDIQGHMLMDKTQTLMGWSNKL